MRGTQDEGDTGKKGGVGDRRTGGLFGSSRLCWERGEAGVGTTLGLWVAQQSSLARGRAGSAGRLRPGKEHGKGPVWGSI